MLTPQHFIEKGYKRRELGNYEKNTLADYLLQKLIDDEDGKKYYINIYVYDYSNFDYSKHERVKDWPKYGFQSEVQFREGKHPAMNVQVLIDSRSTVQEIEDTFEELFKSTGAEYESYYD